MVSSALLRSLAAIVPAVVVVGGGTALPAQQLRQFQLTARPASAEIEPGKVVTNSWLYNGQLPAPTLRVTEGDTVRVVVVNDLPEFTTVHWHGLPVPMRADGVPGVSQGPIGVGQRYVYEFTADVPGTYWYHPHVELQIDRGLVGALIVEPKNPADDPPFDREYLVQLDDWLPGDPVLGREPTYSDFLINGRTSAGQVPMMVRAGEVVRLRVLNMAAQTNFVFTVDGHPMRVTHTDGQPVVPVTSRAIPIGAGERYDVYVTADNPGKWSIAVAPLMDRTQTVVRGILAYEGVPDPEPSPSYVPSWLSNAPLLSYADLAAARPLGPISPNPDRSYALALDHQRGGGYVWTIGGQAFPDADPIDVTEGEIVRFAALNHTPHHHPMHIHGHFFRVLGSGGGTAAPLVKDTVLVPPGHRMRPTRLDAEFLADNPGNWPYHCHMIYHMAAGMMRLVRYVGADTDGDGLPDGSDFDPSRAYPVSWSMDLGGAYQPGARVGLMAQWPAGEAVVWWLGPVLAAPVSLGGLGDLHISPLLGVGGSVADATAVAMLPLRIPGAPSLSGVQVGLQGIGTHGSLVPGGRLSTLLYLDVR